MKMEEGFFLEDSCSSFHQEGTFHVKVCESVNFGSLWDSTFFLINLKM